MSVRWLLGFSPRWLPPLLVCVVVALCYLAAHMATTGGLIKSTFSPRQVFGTVLMFSLLPGYLLWSMSELRHRTLLYTGELEGTLLAEDIARVQHQADRFPTVGWLLVLVGGWWGMEQNSYLIDRLLSGVGNWFDYVFVGSNVLVWALVAVLFCWRIPLSVTLSRGGMRANLDLYQLDRVKPLTRIALVDLLVVAGAMAFMPLQSLDAEFRLVNYQAGVVAGIPGAILFFFLPLFGISKQMRQAKRTRLAELQRVIEQVPRSDIVRLEQVSAHISRIRSISSVPLDLSLLWRIFVYVIIPPIAWVFAALVENLVDQF